MNRDLMIIPAIVALVVAVALLNPGLTFCSRLRLNLMSIAASVFGLTCLAVLVQAK